MNDDQKLRLESWSRKGKEVWFKDKGSGEKQLWGTIEDEVYVMVDGDDDPYKHVLQRIRRATYRTWDPPYYYRTGYYTFSRKVPSRLVWGQYAQLLTEDTYRELLKKAKGKGWGLC